jgi:hypothetical protein
MEVKVDTMRDSDSQSESFGDLPMSLKDKMELADDIDFFSPFQNSQSSTFTQEALRSMNLTPANDITPFANNHHSFHVLERQIHGKGHLENITEEESYELDNSKGTDRYRSNNDFDITSFMDSVEHGREQSNLKLNKCWPVSNEKRRCQLAQSTNILDTDKTGDEARTDTRLILDEASPLTEKKILSNSKSREASPHINFVYNYQNVGVNKNDNNGPFSKSNERLSPLKDAFPPCSPIIHKPVPCDDRDKMEVGGGQFYSFGRIGAGDDIANHSKPLFTNFIYQNKNIEQNCSKSDLTKEPADAPKAQLAFPANGQRFRKIPSFLSEPKPCINIIQNNNYFISISTHNTNNVTNNVSLRNLNPTKPKSTTNPNWKTDEPKYDFGKKSKPFKEESFCRMSKQIKTNKSSLREFAKPSLTCKAEIFKTRISKLSSMDKHELSSSSVEKSKGGLVKSESGTFDM